jgi:hypothetical protein
MRLSSVRREPVLPNLSWASVIFTPPYVRGLAYLAAHHGAEAAVEFQKILDHRGIVLSDPIGALAHLQLGRAYALAGNETKAKSASQDFLTIWKKCGPGHSRSEQGQIRQFRALED